MDGQKSCNVHSSVCLFFIIVYILGNTQETNVLVMKVKILSFYWDSNFLFGYDKPNVMEMWPSVAKRTLMILLNGLF